MILTLPPESDKHLKQTHDRIIAIAARNLAALVSGGEIGNLVDGETGYRARENRL